MSYPIHVDCSGNQLTDLNTYVMQYTQDLDCSDNLFTRLDVEAAACWKPSPVRATSWEARSQLNGKCHAQRLTAIGKAMSAMPWSGKKTVPPRTP